MKNIWRVTVILGIIFTYVKANDYNNLLKEGYHLSSEIRTDITNDKLKDKVLLLNKTDTIKLLILINKGNNGFEEIINSNSAITMVKSMPEVSFKQVGFDVSVGQKNILYNEESEGVTFSIKDLKETTLILTSIKDGFLDRFKFYFLYSQTTNKFKLYKVYYLSFSESCGHDLNAIYEVENQAFKNITLDNFDAKAIHKLLYEKPVWINQEMKLNKIQSIELKELYSEVFKLYQNDKVKFKEYVGDFIYKGCKLKYYLDEKYFFEKDLEFSNNLAFFFEKAGYDEEAVYLLKKILEKFPNRTVAYYNLGDAYWALGKKEEALEAYSFYVEQMRKEGKEKRIPNKVLQLTKEKRIAKFIPKGGTFFELEKGDLNRDGIEDAILIFKKKNGNRPLVILLGTKNKTYKLKAQNENIVYRADAYKTKLDPFNRIDIGDGYFTVFHLRKDKKVWLTNTTIFKYISKNKNCFLYKESSDTIELQANTCVMKETRNYEKIVKDFGVVSFTKYNNHMNEEYR